MIFGAPPEHPYGAPSPSTRPAAMAADGELATAASTVPILCLLSSDGEQHAHPSDQWLRFKSGQSTIIFIRRSSIQTHHARPATASTLLADSHLIPTARFHLPQHPFRPSQQATVQRLTPKSPSSSHFPHPTLSSINGPLIQPRSSPDEHQASRSRWRYISMAHDSERQRPPLHLLHRRRHRPCQRPPSPWSFALPPDLASRNRSAIAIQAHAQPTSPSPTINPSTASSVRQTHLHLATSKPSSNVHEQLTTTSARPPSARSSNPAAKLRPCPTSSVHTQSHGPQANHHPYPAVGDSRPPPSLAPGACPPISSHDGPTIQPSMISAQQPMCH
ncbi:hypothetical protein ACLOJK_015324 [Asimina triloba]